MDEANEMRGMEVWDEGDMHEVDDLKCSARETGETIHMAEMMAIGSIKSAETAAKAKLKVGLVYRGDDTRDQNGQMALLRDLKSLQPQ